MTTSTSKCRSCHAPIVWVMLPSGKAMPCNPPELTVVNETVGVVKGRVSHYATCPDADEWRKP